MQNYHKQTAKFIATVAENMPSLPDELMQLWIQNPKSLQQVLGGLNPLMPVDRKNPSDFWNNWGARPFTTVHPELESVGPEKFRLSDLDWFELPNMAFKPMIGVYEHLKNSGILTKCLSLQEGIALLETPGIATVNLRNVHLWKSISRGRDGSLYVPVITHGPAGYAGLTEDGLYLDKENVDHQQWDHSMIVYRLRK